MQDPKIDIHATADEVIERAVNSPELNTAIQGVIALYMRQLSAVMIDAIYAEEEEPSGHSLS